MSDEQHARKLVLAARIESKSPSHAVIGVFQNNGKAGELCVEAEYAEQVVGLINAATSLLSACEQIAERAENAGEFLDQDSGSPYEAGESMGEYAAGSTVATAIAKAKEATQ